MRDIKTYLTEILINLMKLRQKQENSRKQQQIEEKLKKRANRSRFQQQAETEAEAEGHKEFKGIIEEDTETKIESMREMTRIQGEEFKK